MRKRLKELTVARDIVNALGGETAVAEMTHVGPKAVNNWSNWNKFPAVTFAKMMFELNNRGFTGPPRLWRQVGIEGLRIRRVSK